MKIIFKKYVLILFLLTFSSCTWFQSSPAMSQLQVRELQTRTFDTPDTKAVLKMLVAVLQDDGFIIKAADSELGFLTAVKETDLGRGSAIWTTGKNDPPRWEKTEIIETTANVTQFGKQVKVRANFTKKILDNYGSTYVVRPVLDQGYYQEFFAKVDKGLFLQKENL